MPIAAVASLRIDSRTSHPMSLYSDFMPRPSAVPLTTAISSASPADKAKYAGQRAVEAEWIKSRRQRLEREARERAADDAEYEKSLLTTPATPLRTPRRPAPGTPVLTPATTPRLRRLDTPGADGDDEGGVDWGDDDDVSSDAASTIDADEVYCAPCAPKD